MFLRLFNLIYTYVSTHRNAGDSADLDVEEGAVKVRIVEVEQRISTILQQPLGADGLGRKKVWGERVGEGRREREKYLYTYRYMCVYMYKYTCVCVYIYIYVYRY